MSKSEDKKRMILDNNSTYFRSLEVEELIEDKLNKKIAD